MLSLPFPAACSLHPGAKVVGCALKDYVPEANKEGSYPITGARVLWHCSIANQLRSGMRVAGHFSLTAAWLHWT